MYYPYILPHTLHHVASTDCTGTTQLVSLTLMHIGAVFSKRANHFSMLELLDINLSVSHPELLKWLTPENGSISCMMFCIEDLLQGDVANWLNKQKLYTP